LASRAISRGPRRCHDGTHADDRRPHSLRSRHAQSFSEQPKRRRCGFVSDHVSGRTAAILVTVGIVHVIPQSRRADTDVLDAHVDFYARDAHTCASGAQGKAKPPGISAYQVRTYTSATTCTTQIDVHGRSVPSARRTAISSSRAASTRASCSGVQLMIPERTYRARHRRLTLTSGDQTLLGTGIRQGGGITTAAAAMIRRTGTAPVDASNPHCQVSEMARAVKTGTFWNSWVLFAHRQTQPAKPGHPGQKIKGRLGESPQGYTT
jgi:hypothetical protein